MYSFFDRKPLRREFPRMVSTITPACFYVILPNIPAVMNGCQDLSFGRAAKAGEGDGRKEKSWRAVQEKKGVTGNKTRSEVQKKKFPRNQDRDYRLVILVLRNPCTSTGQNSPPIPRLAKHSILVTTHFMCSGSRRSFARFWAIISVARSSER